MYDDVIGELDRLVERVKQSDSLFVEDAVDVAGQIREKLVSGRPDCVAQARELIYDAIDSLGAGLMFVSTDDRTVIADAIAGLTEIDARLV